MCVREKWAEKGYGSAAASLCQSSDRIGVKKKKNKGGRGYISDSIWTESRLKLTVKKELIYLGWVAGVKTRIKKTSMVGWPA